MKKTTIVFVIAFALTSFADYPEQSQAQLFEATNNFSESEQVDFNFNLPPETDDAPEGRKRGTGSRGRCSIASGTEPSPTLTPLIPYEPWGLTVTESPTIWVNVKYESESGKIEKVISGRFSLQDIETHEKLDPPLTDIQLPQESGSFSIALPHSLKPGKMYRWYFVLNDCSEIYVEGWVQRVENPELVSLKNKTLLGRIAFYANNGIWYDALNEAAKLYCHNQQSNNQQNVSLDNPWAALLKDDRVQLDDIAQNYPICPQ